MARQTIQAGRDVVAARHVVGYEDGGGSHTSRVGLGRVSGLPVEATTCPTSWRLETRY